MKSGGLKRGDYLESLNPAQREAVEHFEGPLLILAGAGSGKTRVLTCRIAHLIERHGVEPNFIMAVTFTNKAAQEMRDRVRALLGSEPAGMWIGTFHSVGARILRRHAARLGFGPGFTILDSDDSQREVKRVMERLKVGKPWKPKTVQAALSAAKNQLVSPEEFTKTAFDPFARVVAEVYPEYQSALKSANELDFDDLLVKPVELFTSHADVLAAFRERFAFILVDEYQDTNRAQYRFLELLAREHGNLGVVGDDDQSIYGWRGADIRNILGFETDFPNTRTIRLERNYRSTKVILRAANSVIAENKHRKGKTLYTENDVGPMVTLAHTADEVDEAEWIQEEIAKQLDGSSHTSLKDYVVLYRTNAQSRAFEEAFRRADTPYRIIGGVRFYERREIKDVIAYLKLISNPKDASALLRIVNYPRRGIGDASLTALLEGANAAGSSLLEAARRASSFDRIPSSGAAALEKFAMMIDRYRGLKPHLRVHELLAELIGELKLVEMLRAEGHDGMDRAQNVEELVAAASEFGAEPAVEEEDLLEVEDVTELDLFLQKISLIADVDNLDPEADAVTLMTLHNAKGLEFPVVFISGLEEGLFPLSRSHDSLEELEEERRLFYVGITRAKEKLYLSHAKTRRRGGDWMVSSPSAFLLPLPSELIVEHETPRFAEREMPRRRRREWMDWPGRRQRDSLPGELTYDFSDSQDTPTLPPLVEGARVRHPRFGIGTVTELDGDGWDVKAVVDFESVGRKKLVVRYANLDLA